MSLTSLLQGASYNQHTLLQGLISYMKQVTLVVYASVNQCCQSSAVSVTSQLLWPSATTNYGGQRLQRGYL